MAEKGEPLLNISERNASWNKLALEISRERLSIVPKQESPHSEPEQKPENLPSQSD